MISLLRLLEEISSRPKVIIFAGSPGAGKSSFVKDAIKDFDMTVLNVDDFYKENMRQANQSLDIKNANREGRSKSSSAMQKAIKSYQSALNQAMDNKENIVLDATSGSLKKTAELRNELNMAGYDVMMIYVHSSLKKALKRNDRRFAKSQGQERSLPPDVVVKTWSNVTRNYNQYRNIFGDDFVSVVNDEKPFTLSSYDDIKKIYLDPYQPQDSLPTSPQDQAYQDKIEATNKAYIDDFISKRRAQDIIDNSVSKDDLTVKVKQFLAK